jgi:hypothetical protein
MGPLSLQIMILVASFLFYRILKTGFDSWKAILIDFGIVVFLFALQYYLQRNQEKSNINETMFPAGTLSSFFGASFPSKIATKHQVEKNISTRPEYGCYLQLSSDTFIDSKTKRILHFTDKIHPQSSSNPELKIQSLALNLVQEITSGRWSGTAKNQDIWNDQKFNVKNDGFYIVQMTLDTDIIPYSSKLSIRGKNNRIDKTVHDGENSFIVYLKGNDNVHFELENSNHNIMLHDTTTLYIIQL